MTEAYNCANKHREECGKPVITESVEDFLSNYEAKLDHFELMRRVWKHGFTVANPEKSYDDRHDISEGVEGVMLTEAPMQPKRNRERMVELMFEHFGVKSVAVVIQACMAILAYGRVSGMILDSGDGVTHTVPIWNSI